jgi:hypothetical protein
MSPLPFSTSAAGSVPILTDVQALLVAQLVFVWSLCTYLIAKERPSSGASKSSDSTDTALLLILRYALTAAGGCFVLPDGSPVWKFLIVFVGLAPLAALLPKVREWLRKAPQIAGLDVSHLGAELEVLAFAAAVALAMLEAQGTNGPVHLLTTAQTFPAHRLAIICALAAAIPFGTRGGTYIVRGILEKSGAAPRVTGREAVALATVADGNGEDASAQTDTTEYNRGRVIGAIERIIVGVAVAAGNYEVLAFLAAAKGFVRGKSLENRDFSEYFLIGNLASSLVALIIGLCAQRLLKAW